MVRIHVSEDGLYIGFLRSMLEENGIACHVRNEFLRGAIGELPPVECWPELWVLDDADAERAKALIAG